MGKSTNSTVRVDATPRYTTYRLPDDGVFPNNGGLELIVYHQPFTGGAEVTPEVVEHTFRNHGWVNAWRNGLYSMHHYHSTAHEVLGIYCGWVEALVGGEKGRTVRVEAGDVLVIPAGVSHKNIGQSEDFRVVGAYPDGQRPDMQYGKPGERPQTDRNIARVPLPVRDPLYGSEGPLRELWKNG